MFTGIAPTSTGRPLSLNAYAHYVYNVGGYSIDETHVLRLARNQADDGYEGRTRHLDYDLRIRIADATWPNPYVITLAILHNEYPITQTNWNHLQPLGVTRWDTGTLTTVHYPVINEATVHVMG